MKLSWQVSSQESLLPCGSTDCPALPPAEELQASAASAGGPRPSHVALPTSL